MAALAAAAGILLVTASSALADGGYGATSTPSPITYTASTQPLLVVGVSNLRAYRPGAAAPAAAAAPTTAAGVLNAFVPPLLLPTGPRSPFGAASVAGPAASPAHRGGGGGGSPGTTPIFPGRYPGTIGWPGINGQQDAAVEGYPLEPPDQGLCAANGTVLEVINNTLQAYSPTGRPQSPIIPTAYLFDQAPDASLSDPRCYWDRDTQRWYVTEFTFEGTATQFVAVSQSPDPLGKYTVFGFDTTDLGAPSSFNCPCFGDFDQIGADLNGFYITTNEFPQAAAGFNGTDIYALAKQQLAAAADGYAPPPTVVRYAVTADAFVLPYHVSPAQTPPDGSYFPNTELFVESDSVANVDNRLLVYALQHTSLLRRGGIPPLAASILTSEQYTYPPNAHQKAGSGPQYTLDTDFNAIQEVTETNGTLYAELDSGGPYDATTTVGTGPAEADWFILDPSRFDPLSVRLANQGIVSNPTESIMYPDIAVNGEGNGYLLFSVSGPHYFPSPGYVAFDGSGGAQGPALLPAQGIDDETGFTCIPPYGIPGDPFNDCRWGDYSMGVSDGSRIYMATEYIPLPGVPVPPDHFVNWGTFVWGAPAR